MVGEKGMGSPQGEGAMAGFCSWRICRKFTLKIGVILN